MSLQYYPYEDLHVKPAVRPEGLEPGASDYVPIAIINLTLAMALVSFAVNGGVIGALVVLGMIIGFNVLALRTGPGAGGPRRRGRFKRTA